MAGKHLLYAFCDEHRVPVEQIGKLVVAVSEGELDRLNEIQEQAARNGVDDLRFLDAGEVQNMEPAVECVGALLSPSTGIVDSHALMLALQAEIESYGGIVVCNSEVSSVTAHGDGFFLSLATDEDQEFVCNTLINASGHTAQAITERLRIVDPHLIPPLTLAKGHYFAYQGKSPFSRLVYPIPFDGGLGIHATIDLGGAARFGPDVTWIDSVDYSFDESRKPDFMTAIRSYFPAVEEDKLVPAYCGVRSKITGPGEAPADFIIHGEEDHGVRGLVNLFGIDSPGLTSSLAIAEYVKHLPD